MHPAISVIFFTVTSGAGYGLLALLALLRIASVDLLLSSHQLAGLVVLGLVLISAGLVSSTFHLANPKNAWRSFSRFRTSWLSREAVLAVLLYPFAILWAILEWNLITLEASPFLLSVIFFSLIISLATVYATGMIYACLKTIRQWNTLLTPINYVLIGLSLGALVLILSLSMMHVVVPKILLLISLGLMIIAAASKAIYYVHIGRPAGPTINTALGFGKATVRLLDVGHSSGTFLTEEFGYQVARFKILSLRVAVFIFSFCIPFIIISGLFGNPSIVLILFSSLIAYLGVFIERWLFFAEARHVVNLFHGSPSA